MRPRLGGGRRAGGEGPVTGGLGGGDAEAGSLGGGGGTSVQNPIPVNDW